MRLTLFTPRGWRWLIAALLAGSALGCADLGYYMQAARGQMSLMGAAQPIDTLLENPALNPQLKQRLQQAQTIRRFASLELGLPDNDSYRNYAHLPRPFAIWNVVAAPELSLQPVTWCFPVAGCVSYRGYYSQAEAQAFASGLRANGQDVQVSGIPAYSTLGWFSDPILSSFINYQDADLARLIFHELAHQMVYLPGDTGFNESFATAVAQAGVERWLECRADTVLRNRDRQGQARQQQFVALLARHRQQLQEAYENNSDDATKRLAKQRILQSLQNEYSELKIQWGGFAGYDRFFADSVGNAHLAAVAAYNELVPGFTSLLRQHTSYADFYHAAEALAKLPTEQRMEQLRTLAAMPIPMGDLEQGPCAPEFAATKITNAANATNATNATKSNTE